MATRCWSAWPATPPCGILPVIVISVVDDIDSVVRCIEMGAVDYLPKPFNPTVLRARLQTSLRRKKVRDLERSYLQQEIVLRQRVKLATLGKLSTGMAHELNNPVAAGASFRTLDLPGVERWHGAGVYYGAAHTEAANYQDQDVVVIGAA